MKSLKLPTQTTPEFNHFTVKVSTTFKKFDPFPRKFFDVRVTHKFSSLKRRQLSQNTHNRPAQFSWRPPPPLSPSLRKLSPKTIKTPIMLSGLFRSGIWRADTGSEWLKTPPVAMDLVWTFFWGWGEHAHTCSEDLVRERERKTFSLPRDTANNNKEALANSPCSQQGAFACAC